MYCCQQSNAGKVEYLEGHLIYYKEQAHKLMEAMSQQEDRRKSQLN